MKLIMENWRSFLQEQRSYSLSQRFKKLEKDIKANPQALVLRNTYLRHQDEYVKAQRWGGEMCGTSEEIREQAAKYIRKVCDLHIGPATGDTRRSTRRQGTREQRTRKCAKWEASWLRTVEEKLTAHDESIVRLQGHIAEQESMYEKLKSNKDKTRLKSLEDEIKRNRSILKELQKEFCISLRTLPPPPGGSKTTASDSILRARQKKEIKRVQKALVDQVQAEFSKSLAPMWRVSKIRVHLKTYLGESLFNPGGSEYLADLIIPTRREFNPFVPWSRAQNLAEFLDIGKLSLKSLADTKYAGIPIGKIIARFLPDNWDHSIMTAIGLLAEYIYDNILGGKTAEPMEQELLVMIVKSLVEYVKKFVLGAAVATFEQKKAAAVKFMLFGGSKRDPLKKIIKYIMEHRNTAITPAIIKGLVVHLRSAAGALQGTGLNEIEEAFKDVADLFEAIADLKLK